MGASKEWWKSFFKRIKFPETGHFLIIPGDDRSDECRLIHCETGADIDVGLDEGESLEDCAEFFREVLPGGMVAPPMGPGVKPTPPPLNGPLPKTPKIGDGTRFEVIKGGGEQKLRVGDVWFLRADETGHLHLVKLNKRGGSISILNGYSLARNEMEQGRLRIQEARRSRSLQPDVGTLNQEDA